MLVLSEFSGCAHSLRAAAITVRARGPGGVTSRRSRVGRNDAGNHPKRRLTCPLFFYVSCSIVNWRTCGPGVVLSTHSVGSGLSQIRSRHLCVGCRVVFARNITFTV